MTLDASRIAPATQKPPLDLAPDAAESTLASVVLPKWSLKTCRICGHHVVLQVHQFTLRPQNCAQCSGDHDSYFHILAWYCFHCHVFLEPNHARVFEYPWAAFEALGRELIDLRYKWQVANDG